MSPAGRLSVSPQFTDTNTVMIMHLLDTELQLKLHLLGTLVAPVTLCWLLVLAESISVRSGARALKRHGVPVRQREDLYLQHERSEATNTRISS